MASSPNEIITRRAYFGSILSREIQIQRPLVTVSREPSAHSGSAKKIWNGFEYVILQHTACRWPDAVTTRHSIRPFLTSVSRFGLENVVRRFVRPRLDLITD